jgi:hypothetical protein
MSDSVTVALITGTCTASTAIVSIAINTFWINRAFSRIDRRLELIEADLKQFYKDITQIKLKIGLD